MNDMDYHMDGLSHVRMITSDTHNHQWWCRMITNDTDNHQWQCTMTTNDMAYHQWYHRTILLLVKIFFPFFYFYQGFVSEWRLLAAQFRYEPEVFWFKIQCLHHTPPWPHHLLIIIITNIIVSIITQKPHHGHPVNKKRWAGNTYPNH